METVQVKPPPQPPTSEFDHAIHFLNKIKTRYPDGPNANIYKQFLEVLQTYRKEQQSLLRDPGTYALKEKQMMTDVRSSRSHSYLTSLNSLS